MQHSEHICTGQNHFQSTKNTILQHWEHICKILRTHLQSHAAFIRVGVGVGVGVCVCVCVCVCLRLSPCALSLSLSLSQSVPCLCLRACPYALFSGAAFLRAPAAASFAVVLWYLLCVCVCVWVCVCVCVCVCMIVLSWRLVNLKRIGTCI